MVLEWPGQSADLNPDLPFVLKNPPLRLILGYTHTGFIMHSYYNSIKVQVSKQVNTRPTLKW